jgi:hypothetical protein
MAEAVNEFGALKSGTLARELAKIPPELCVPTEVSKYLSCTLERATILRSQICQEKAWFPNLKLKGNCPEDLSSE